MSQTEPSHPIAVTEPHPTPAWRRWLLRIVVAALAVPICGAAYIYHKPLLDLFQPPSPTPPPPDVDVVSVVAPNTIMVQADSALEKSLKFDEIQKQSVDIPALNVTGSIMARLPPGSDEAQSRWDFATPEVASAYSDWVKARADIL